MPMERRALHALVWFGFGSGCKHKAGGQEGQKLLGTVLIVTLLEEEQENGEERSAVNGCRGQTDAAFC